MRGAVVAVACLMLVFVSGCLAEKDDPETDSTSTTSSSASKSGTGSSGTKSVSASGTKAPGNATNRAPTVNLTASPDNGTVPLNVTFSLTGADADGDALRWVLTLANTTLANGTGLPASHAHNFTTAGNHTVVVTVWDGKVNVTANVTVSVAAATTAPPAPTGPDPCEATGETSLGGQLYVDRISWVFRESNGRPGLQYTAEPSLIGEYDDAGKGCIDGDTLLF